MHGNLEVRNIELWLVSDASWTNSSRASGQRALGVEDSVARGRAAEKRQRVTGGQQNRGGAAAAQPPTGQALAAAMDGESGARERA